MVGAPDGPPTGQRGAPDRTLSTNSPTLTDWGKKGAPPKSLLERELVGVPCVESFPQYINTPLAPLYV